MANISKLGIVIETTGADQATAALERLGISANVAMQMERKRQAAFQDRFATDAAARSMGLAEIEAYKLAAAQGAAGEAAGGHGIQLGRLRQELGTLAGRMTGTNTALDRMVGALGGMAIGDPVVIAALAGIAAIGYAYEKLTERAAAAQKQAEDTRKEFDKIAHLSVAAQGEEASRLYGGDPLSGDKLARQSVQALREQQQKYLRESKATETFTGAFGITSEHLTADAKKAAETLREVNKELQRRNDLLANVTGAGGSIEIAGKLEAQAAQAGFVTDRLKEQKKAADEARKAAETLRHENAMTITDAVDAADKANTARVQGVRALQAEEEAQSRLLSGIQNGTAAYNAQKDAEDARNLVAHAGIAITDEQYTEALRAADAIVAQKRAVEELRDTYKNIASDIAQAVQVINKVVKDANKSQLDSFKETFQYLQKIAQAAGIGFGAGAAIGSRTGSATQGALGGIIAGGIAGEKAGPWGIAAGALSGFIGGIIGAGAAAREAAKHMREMQTAIAQSMAALRASVSGDTLGAGIAQIEADREARRKAIEEGYSGGSASSDQVRKRNALLAEMNALEDEAIRQLRVEADLKKAQIVEDIRVQILRNNGDAAAADAMAKAIEQERRFAELRKQKIDEALIAELAESERVRDIAAEKKKADDAAQAAAEDLKRAADAAAEAAQQAAEKARAQAQAVEDINVELLRAKGQGTAADDLEFQLAQQRRLEDAQKNQSTDYVQRLLELQQLQRDSRAAQGLIDSTGGGGGRGGFGASQALAAVSAVVTDRSALELIDLTRTSVNYLSYLPRIHDKIGGGAGGTGPRFEIHNHFDAGMDDAAVEKILTKLVARVDEEMGSTVNIQGIYSGRVGRN